MAKISQISQEEYKRINDEAAAAHEILTDERFQFVRDYFQQTIDYTTSRILNNAVHEVEETTFGEKVSRLFRIPKKEQVDELVGQYKLAKKFFEDLQFYIDTKEDLETEMARGTARVQEDTDGR